MEVLVSASIFALVATIAAASFSSQAKITRRVTEKSRRQTTAMFTLEQLVRDIRQAKYLSIDSATQMTLKLPDRTDPTKIIEKIYYTTNQNLFLNEGGQVTQINSDDTKINQLNFSGQGGTAGNEKTLTIYPFVKISLTFDTYQIQTLATPRNFKKIYD